jgi:thiamine transport system permease protein
MPVVIYRLLSQPGALNIGQAQSMSVLLMLVCGLGFIIIELAAPEWGSFDA